LAYEAALCDSGVAETLKALLPKGGRPRQLGPNTVLLGVMLALDGGRPAHLKAAWRALSQLSVHDQLALGFVATGDHPWHQATYRQYEDAFTKIVKAIDPSPVPSFKRNLRGVFSTGRENLHPGKTSLSGTRGQLRSIG